MQNETLTEVEMFPNAKSPDSTETRVCDDVSNDVTDAAANQKRDANRKQEVPWWLHCGLLSCMERTSLLSSVYQYTSMAHPTPSADDIL